jgi:iron-sulfur cluster assembly protein
VELHFRLKSKVKKKKKKNQNPKMTSKSLISTGIKAVKATRRLALTRAAITMTPSALDRVKELMQLNPDMAGLRIGVKTRGCNGLTYTLEFAKEKKKFDEIVEQSGVKLFVDAKAQLTLLGTEMDYVKSVLSSEFVFNNPNIKSTCGCGESFQV